MLRKRAFAGLRRYQTAARIAETEQRTVVARQGRASLQTRNDFKIGRNSAPPVVLVPSLINPPDVLDLTPRRSLLRHLLREGHEAYLVDWGTPETSNRDMGLSGHVESLLLPLLEQLNRPAILIGYCLGGTLAIGAASALAHRGTPLAALATIAAPWNFEQYDNAFRSQVDTIWQQSRETCEKLGMVPMEVLQTGFWSLDPERTIRKYADFSELSEDSLAYRGFITLEDWANDGAPLTLECGRDLIDHFYGANMPGVGTWRVDSAAADPAALACPTLAFASTRDTIVPAATTPPADRRIDLSLGHVGMMIGGRAQEMLWEPLSKWISDSKA